MFTLIKRGVISNDDFVNLTKLPNIRDKVFFPDYYQMGYTPVETVITEDGGLFSIALDLTSVVADRRLALTYSFSTRMPSALEGFFGDTIFIQSKVKGWDNNVQMKVRLDKMFDIALPNSYTFLKSYSGSFDERVERCLSFIKKNYDDYALRIIQGKEWDSNSWESYM